MLRILISSCILMTATQALAGYIRVNSDPDGQKPFFYEEDSRANINALLTGKFSKLHMLDASQSDVKLSQVGEEWLAGVQSSLIQFAQGVLAIELLQVKPSSVDVDYVSNRLWRDVFRNKKAVVAQLKQCPNKDCVDHLDMIQSLFHLWLERIGAKSEVHSFQGGRKAELEDLLKKYTPVEMESEASKKVSESLEGQKQGLLKSLEDRFAKVKALFAKKTVEMNPKVIARIWTSLEGQIDQTFEAGEYRDALKLVVRHLAYSAVNQDGFQLSYPQFSKQSEKHFSPEFRYSEEEWWTSIKNSYLEHLKSGKPVAEYKIPFRVEYGASFSLKCHACGRDGAWCPSDAGLVAIGFTAFNCYSGEQAYSLGAIGVGPQFGLQYSDGTLLLASTTPHLAWVSPEGRYAAIRGSIALGVSKGATVATSGNKVAVLTDSGLGLGGNLSVEYLDIQPLGKNDPKVDPEYLLGK